MQNAALFFTVVLALGGCNSQPTTQVRATEAKDSRNSNSTSSRQPLPGSHNSPAKNPTQRYVVEVAPNEKFGSVVRSVFQDSHGVLWIGGEGDLLRHDGKTLTSYDVKDALGNGVTVKQVIQDKNGAIWCGTEGGITRIDGDSFKSFGEKDGLLSSDVWCLAADRNGIWIGTIDGVCKFDGKTFTEFPLPPSKPDPTRGVTSAEIVHCIFVDSRRRVWFGTNGGAYIYDGKKLDHVSKKDGLPNDVVHKILEDSSGNMWFGTTHNGISRYDGEVFTNFTADGTIDGKEIWCIHEDSAGNIWFSGKHFGVYRYDGNSFTNFGEKDGITSPGLMSILEDANKQLWLGGVHGLFQYNGDAFVRVKMEATATGSVR